MADEKSILETSPLAQTNPKSLDELFEMDPEKLTKEDIEVIVSQMREARARFAAAEAAGKKAPLMNASGKNLTLEDLDL